ncbi:hypothetical protein [Chachezhania antarctica]|uniref:hypothetical protein n=1 Tax=Chachezhania antarctica TaxID=2340860 RepID=UPI000EAE2089|nr:hypothetical protein [Chachezhania antarctica]|tara:strand:+ start:1384 stop:1767 length:384 start_codon:yes stop_codon:yes gene_type:complete
MTKHELTDAELERMLADLRLDTGPDDLMARVLADAAAEQPKTAHIIPLAVRRRAPRRFAGQLRAQLGGWAGLGGLAAACAAGVWIGFAPPQGLPDPAELMSLADSEIEYMDTQLLAAIEAESLAEDG